MLYGVFGGSPESLFDDDDEQKVVQTSWGGDANEDYEDEPWSAGGGRFVSGTRFIVWRCKATRMWLREMSLGSDDDVLHGFVVPFPSPVLTVDAFMVEGTVALCCATRDYAYAITLRPSSSTGSYLARCAGEEYVSGRCVSLAELPPPGQRTWASESVLFGGCKDGGVARFDLVSRRTRFTTQTGIGRRLLSRLVSPGGVVALEQKKNLDVVAIACGGTSVFALRADGSLVGWSVQGLVPTVSLGEVGGGSGQNTTLLASDSHIAVVYETRCVVVEYNEDDQARVVVSSVVADRPVRSSTLRGDTLWTFDGSSLETTRLSTTRHEDSTHRRGGVFDDDEELERKVKRAGGWLSYFDSWESASAAIEAFYLRQLARPRRFSARAISRALNYGLPQVLRRHGGLGHAQDALEACRAWHRLVEESSSSASKSFSTQKMVSEAEELEARCEALVGCWRQFIDLVEAQAAVQRTPLGFVRDSPEAPPLVQAGQLSLVEPTFYDDDDEDEGLGLAFAARSASRLVGERAAQIEDVEDDAARLVAEWRLAADDDMSRALRRSQSELLVADSLRTLAATHARLVAAADVKLALACADLFENDDRATVETALVAARSVARGRHDSLYPSSTGGSALARAAASDCAAANARRGYSAARDALLALSLADAVGRPAPCADDLANALEAMARRLGVAAWICSTAAPGDVSFPACAPAVESAPVFSTDIAGADLAWACATTADIGTEGPYAAARAACCVAEIRERACPSEDDEGLFAAESARAYGDLAAAAKGILSEKAWYASMAYEATLDDPVASGLDAGSAARSIFFGRRHADPKAAARVAGVLLHREDGHKYADLEARLFEFTIGPELDDIEAAFAATTTQPEHSWWAGSPPDAATSDDRLARVVRSACERGALDRLSTLPWSPTEAKAVDVCLERLARRGGPSIFDHQSHDGVDYYACLYAWRVKRSAWDEAARAMLELATRQDHEHRLANRKKTALGARLAAHNALSILPDRDAFVTSRPPVDESIVDEKQLRLVSRIDLERILAEQCARLDLEDEDASQILSSTSGPTDVALALAREGKYEAAIDLVRAQPRTNKLVEPLSFVFLSLAKRCVELDDDDCTDNEHEKDSVPKAGSYCESPFITAGTKQNCQRLHYGSRSKPTWDLLARLIDEVDSADFNYCCAKASARAILASGRSLPTWLVDKLVGLDQCDFNGVGADPAALVRLYLKFDKLKAACDLLADLVRRISSNQASAACVPFSHIEAVLNRTDNSLDEDETLQVARKKLLAALESYLAYLAKESEKELASRVLATTTTS